MRSTLSDLQAPPSARTTAFSPLELRDRVAIMLLFDQIVSEDDVERAWRLRQHPEYRETALWRLIKELPDVDTELIHAEAARVYGFEAARIERQVAGPLLHAIAGRLGPDFWSELAGIPLLPVCEDTHPHKRRRRLVFATPDPTRQDLSQLLYRLGFNNFSVSYAPAERLHALLEETFRSPEPASEPVADDVGWDGVERPPEPTATRPSATTNTASAPVSSSTLVTAFEDVLETMVRRDVRAIRLVFETQDPALVYAEEPGQDRRWTVAPDLPPEVFFGTIERRFLQGAAPHRTAELRRWIDGVPALFRMRKESAEDAPSRETILIQRLDYA